MTTSPDETAETRREASALKVRTGDITLSGLMAEPDCPPRGLLVALHGGGSRAAYFDSPVDKASSLLDLAASIGWRAVALDRPGYGDASWLHDRRPGIADQALIVRGALRHLAGPLPVVLVAHSIGSVLALELARMISTTPGDIALLGTAVGGAPLVYTPEQRAMHAAIDTSGPTIRRPPGDRPDPHEWLGPPGAFPEELLESLHLVHAKVPATDMPAAIGAPELLTDLLRECVLPVQFTVAEHEATMAPAGVLLRRAAELIPEGKGSEIVMVRSAGHNLSLTHRARSYHLRVLSFAERLLDDSTRPA